MSGVTGPRLAAAMAIVATLSVSTPLLGAKQEELERRLARIEALLERQGLADMYLRLEELQRELAHMRGELEEQAHAIDGIKQRQRELYLDVDRRLRQTEVGGPAGGERAPVPPPAADMAPSASVATAPSRPPTAAVPSAAEERAYREAFDLLKEGRYKQAVERFRAFLQKYPGSAYADNAQYWLGEAHYVMRDFKTALQDFQKVIDNYPTSPKVADALLKIGYCHYELNDKAQARRVLSDLQSRYPNTTAARLAENRLQQMK